MHHFNQWKMEQKGARIITTSPKPVLPLQLHCKQSSALLAC